MRWAQRKNSVIIIIIDNFCIALFSGVHKLTALLQHSPTFSTLSEKKIEGYMFKKIIVLIHI